MSLVTYIAVLAGLILVHELGHFWAARRKGVVVEEFGIGLPPRVLTLGRRGETVFSLNALPVGGFVRLKGEDEDAGPGSFWRAAAVDRAVILLAGPLANILTAFVVLWFAYTAVIPGGGVWIIQVDPTYPAAAAGIRSGDVIEAVDGRRVTTRGEVVAAIREKEGAAVTLEIRRDGERLTVTVTPQIDPDGVPRVGVVLAERVAVWRAPFLVAQELTGFLVNMVRLPAAAIRGYVSPEEVRPLGPVGIGRVFVDVVEEQPHPRVRLLTILRLAAIISFALGVTNLLPLPALDGGRLMFVLLEIARRGKRVSPSKEGLVHLIGMAFLLTLMAVITYYDILHPPGE